MTPIRVLQVIHLLGRGGGAEEVVANIVKALHGRGFRMSACSLWWGGSYVEELRALGVRVEVLHKRSWHDLSVLARLRALMREERVEIVHTHMFTANLWGRLAAIAARVPGIIATEHLVRSEFTRPVQHFLPDLLLARFTDRIVAVSEEVRRSFIEGGKIPSRKIVTIYNGIDVDAFAPRVGRGAARRELGLPDGRPIVGVVARFFPQKGHRYLFEAIPDVRAKVPDALFVLVGDGPHRAGLEDLAARLGIRDQIIFAGLREEMPRVYPALDVVALPSLAEGFSISILEALAAARPVIATRVGGNAEVIEDGVSGRLVPPRDPRALAAALIEVLADPERARAMGEQGQRVVRERFTRESFVQRTADLYREVLRERGGRA